LLKEIKTARKEASPCRPAGKRKVTGNVPVKEGSLECSIFNA
jgi:hypothetical protein